MQLGNLGSAPEGAAGQAPESDESMEDLLQD